MKAIVIPPGDPSTIEQEAWDAIDMTRLCQELHCLPHAGGIKDQDARDVWLMKQVLLADIERAKLDKQRNRPTT